MNLPDFKNHEVLKAEALNQLYKSIVELGKRYNLDLNQKFIFVNGSILRARELNFILEDLKEIYRKIEKKIPLSFNSFKDGQVLKAENLREIVESIKFLQNYNK